MPAGGRYYVFSTGNSYLLKEVRLDGFLTMMGDYGIRALVLCPV